MMKHKRPRHWPMLHRNLTLAREASGLSISKLAAKTGLSKSYLSELERGIQGNPTLDTIICLAIGLGIGIDEVIGFKASEARSPAAGG